MSSKVLRDAVETYLRANWTACVIAGEENSIDEPPANLDPWLSFGFHGFSETEVSIGNGHPNKNCHRETGLIYINCWVASGTGPDQALTLAESARKLLRHQDLGSGVRLGTASPPSTAIPSKTNSSRGNFFAYQVDIDYVYDYTP